MYQLGNSLEFGIQFPLNLSLNSVLEISGSPEILAARRQRKILIRTASEQKNDNPISSLDLFLNSIREVCDSLETLAAGDPNQKSQTNDSNTIDRRSKDTPHPKQHCQQQFWRFPFARTIQKFMSHQQYTSQNCLLPVPCSHTATCHCALCLCSRL